MKKMKAFRNYATNLVLWTTLEPINFSESTEKNTKSESIDTKNPFSEFKSDVSEELLKQTISPDYVVWEIKAIVDSIIELSSNNDFNQDLEKLYSWEKGLLQLPENFLDEFFYLVVANKFVWENLLKNDKRELNKIISKLEKSETVYLSDIWKYLRSIWNEQKSIKKAKV